MNKNGQSQADETTQETVSQEEAATQEQATENAEAPQEAPTEAAGEVAEESVDSLPEWAQRTIKALREENASRRTRNKELQDKLEGAKSLEEFQAAIAEHEAKSQELEAALALAKDRETVRAEFPMVPQSVFDLATASGTAQEMRDRLNDIAAHFDSKAPAPSGGVRPQGSGLGGHEEEFDPKAVAARIPRYY